MYMELRQPYTREAVVECLLHCCVHTSSIMTTFLASKLTPGRMECSRNFSQVGLRVQRAHGKYPGNVQP